MANDHGESVVSQADIEKRAESLEANQVEEAKKAEEAEAAKKAAEDAALKKGEDEKNPPVPEKKSQPDDPKELRKWATKLSMENAEIRKQLESLAASLSRAQQKKIDWKELAKDPTKLEKAIEERENELVRSHQQEYTDSLTKAAAEITTYEANARLADKDNYPRWAELLPVIKQLSAPTPQQPSGDPRINFNQHPKIVLDELYDLAQKVTDSDPTYKKPPAVAPEKTYSQSDVDSAIKKAVEEHEKNLRAQANGAGISSQSQRSSKGKPGEVNKEALWTMPLGDLKSALQRATDSLQ